MVGADGPTQLATLVQLDPIYVKFNIDEQQVLFSIKKTMRIAGVTLKDLGPIKVDVGLQTEQGYPPTGTLDYVAPEIDSTTGTLADRAVLDNKDGVLQPGLFVRVPIPKQQEVESLSCPTSPSATKAGPLPAHRQHKNVVEQRPVQVGELVDGGLRIIDSGLLPSDCVVVGGLMRA